MPALCRHCLQDLQKEIAGLVMLNHLSHFELTIYGCQIETLKKYLDGRFLGTRYIDLITKINSLPDDVETYAFLQVERGELVQLFNLIKILLN